MGNDCCRVSYEKQTNKIIQGVQYRLSEKSKIFNMLYIYDCDKEKSLKSQPLFLLESFEGFGQANHLNSLYICGGNENKRGGTYFFSYDTNKAINSFSSLINCSYEHRNPSMISYKSDYILVVGGFENVKCEIYLISKKKWQMLPNLPEIREGSSLLADNLNEKVYLFGGKTKDFIENKLQDKFCTSILKLNMKISFSWDVLIVKENSYLLQRSNFALISTEKSKVLIFGGENCENKLTDEIIEFDFKTKIINKIPISLLKPSKFVISNPVVYMDYNYLFDTESNIHIFNQKELTFRLANYCDRDDESEDF